VETDSVPDTPQIEYLGHAGFVVTFAGTTVLIDPWFYPAFLGSWFPFPDNRFLAAPLAGRKIDYLYVSHTHEDHFDERFLRGLDRNVRVICPAYRSKALLRRFRALGFTRIKPLAHKQGVELAPGFRATVLLDTSHKEDSGLLLDMGGYRFLDLNDCNTPLSELPTDIDLLAAQFSGAMWYPNCYDYPPDVMAQKVARVRADLLATLVKKCEVTGAKAYLPCAGPPCFLDPALARFNDRDRTIFPVWKDVAADFAAACPAPRVIEIQPGDTVRVANGEPDLEDYPDPRPTDDLADYAERRRTEWEAFHTTPERPVAHDEVVAYFGTLQRRNQHLLHDFSKTVRFMADGHAWTVHLGQLAEDFVIESEEPLPSDYGLEMSNRVLRAILDGPVGWEEGLLSLRIGLRRNPDVFDSRLMGLLRYGNEPAQTLQMSREMNRHEMIERDGVRMQRFCPHAGEDLAFGTVCDGVIECPRHRWKWDAKTGECIEGGNLKLRVEPVGCRAAGATPGPPARPDPATETTVGGA
jgi:UDP-MurNAc hydroxylase